MRLLLAEDEKELSRALTEVLKHHHYSVDAVYNGADALIHGLSENYDGIILDIMMPKKDGLAVVKELRENRVSTPVLMLTARAEISDRILGLDCGADDYLPKPFAMGELLARVRAMTRRRAEYCPDILEYGDLSLNRSTFELTGPKGSVRLAGKDFQMFEMLMRNPSRLHSTELLMERIWGYDTDVEINVVWVYISSLRKKLATLRSHVQIKAVRGAGYCLEERHD